MAAAAVATTVLPSRAAVVAMKTLTATAMAGAQTTINNQLKAAMAMATETVMMTATTMMMGTKAMAAAETQWQHFRGGGQLGGGGSALAA